MILISGLTKTYNLRPVLRNIDLSVKQGEFVALLGQNGAGKTTLLRVLATLIRPDAGTIQINGLDALSDTARVRGFVGYVSHHPLVYPDLTAYENLQFTARMYGLAQKKAGSNVEISDRIDATLKRVGLLTRAHDRVRTLSRGMMQRLSIARAILHEPSVLLLDEPFTGLDQQSAENLIALLHEMHVAGRTVVMSTHELGRGLSAASRVLVLQAGRIALQYLDDISEQRISQEMKGLR
jgi:heme exporter protein A